MSAEVLEIASPQEMQRQAYEALLERVPAEGRELVAHAYRLAVHWHGDQERESGEPYMMHPLAVASLLCDLNLDPASIAAGVLHDIKEDTDIPAGLLKEEFPPPSPIPDMVDGVTKISKLDFLSPDERKAESLRKMFLAMARDIRVVILKLCDRLHNMRTLKHKKDEAARERVSRETIEIYAPLANRLGMTRVKVELEDHAMRWLLPKEYEELSAAMSMKRTERDRLVQESVAFLQRYLERLNFPHVQVTGRSKHFYSIHKKMRAQNLAFEEVYDLNALRVICDSVEECYALFGHIHQIWPPYNNRMKDYIGTPKGNMYQSLHTTVRGMNGEITEVQIRTHDMHRMAEYGVAAHWKYKEGRTDPTVDERLLWLRQLTEWITEVSDSATFMQAVKTNILSDLVLCYTPRGDIIELPAGATPIDFAYAIHTGVGERCVGAKVNNRLASLRTKLNSGDTIEIQTSQQGHPSRDWIEVAVTGRAKSKIKTWLKSHEMGTWVEAGRSALQRLIAERHIHPTPAELEAGLKAIAVVFKQQTPEDVLAEIGFGSISPHAALARMNPTWGKPTPQGLRKRESRGSARPIIVDGKDDLETRVANCCKAVPGDPIVGFITRGRAITIHHERCPNLKRLAASEVDRQRIIPARWNRSQKDDAPVTHTATFRVHANDREGLLAELSSAISRHKVFINACNTRANRRKGTAILYYEIEGPTPQILDLVEKELWHQRGVVQVERVARPY